jgi:putative ABC transport system permease protein
MDLLWLLKMAWRDSRNNRGRLLLFMSSIVLGIGALVAINAFGENLSRQIEGEAKELLGADLEVQGQRPIPDEVRDLFDSLRFDISEEINFASMVLFPKNGGTRLINVRAVEEKFPFYGKVEAQPASSPDGFTETQSALVDQTLLLQFDAAAGDSVKVGALTFRIAGSVLKVPGQSAITTTVAPPVFIPLRLMDETGLMQKGSRINYKIYARYPEGFDESLFESFIKPRLEALELRSDDVAERKEDLGDAYADLTGFLNLTAFIALLLGCIGVASSVHIYMKEKVQAVAVLRCIGASGKQAMGIYMVQILLMGLIGSSVGAVLGTGIQFFLPTLFQDFLPFDVEMHFAWSAALQGVLLGVVVSFLFALFPLLRVRRISPLRAIRASYDAPESDRKPYIVYLLIFLFIVFFAYIQLGSMIRALVFTGGIAAAFSLLGGVAKGIMWLVRKYFPRGGSFALRQSLANLYRPNNQTLILIVTIGLGTALITTLLVSQELLVNKVKFASEPESRPNMVLFDIQSGQVEEVSALTEKFGLPIVDEVPIVTMRLQSLKDRSVDALRTDTTAGVRSWILNREYRVSYRKALTDSETLVEGRWHDGSTAPGDSIFISLEEGLAEDMKVGIGDPLSFNVQGAILKTYVGSIRKIDWQRVQTNFLVVFPEGVLENAPKFHVLLTRIGGAEQSAAFQREVVSRYPNISVIDLNLVLETVDAVLSKVSFIIRFMAFFSIITGLLVLTGSVIISKFQRVQESVLLRTLGASRSMILKINTLEYFLLGSLAALTGILIALLAGSALAYFSFNTVLAPDLVVLLSAYVVITLLTVVIGLSNSRDVVRKSPLEVLRREAV